MLNNQTISNEAYTQLVNLLTLRHTADLNIEVEDTESGEVLNIQTLLENIEAALK
jgi:hypothetical protein